jgi:hypothetical protein
MKWEVWRKKWESCAPLFEEIVKRLARAGWTLRPGLTLDGRAWRKERAVVPSILRRDASRDRLAAFEACTRVEGHALNTAVQVGTAAGASGVLGYG